MSTISFVATVSLLVISALYFFVLWLRPRPIPGIPHYPVTSIWGDLPALGKEREKYGTPFEPGAFFMASHERLGPLYQVLFGPFRSLLVLNDLQECEDILLRSGSKLEIADNQIATFTPVIPTGQLGLKTDHVWRRHRRAINPITTSGYLSATAPSIGLGATELVNFWKVKMTITKKLGGACFSCRGDLEYSPLDIISRVIAGSSLGLIKHAAPQLIETEAELRAYGEVYFPTTPSPMFNAIRYLFSCLNGQFLLPPWIWALWIKFTLLTPTYTREYKVIQDYVDGCVAASRKVVAEARSIGQEPLAGTCLVDMFAQAEGTSADVMTEGELRDEVITLLFAGHDTTSMTLKWGMKYLTDAPSVQQRLRAELMETLNDAPDQRSLTAADVSDVKKTPYLEAVVHEILRHARVAVATSRQIKEPMIILGHHVPAGVHILFNMPGGSLAATRDKEPELRARDAVRSDSSRKNGFSGRGFFENTSVFQPERWLDKDGQFDPKAGFSAPFGLGIRACAGKALALMELRIYIATLNLAFFFDEVPQELNSYRSVKHITRSPLQAYVNPKLWSSI